MSTGDSGTPQRARRIGCVAIVICLSVVFGIATTVAVSWHLARKWRDDYVTEPADCQWSHASGPKWLYSVSRWPGREERQGVLGSQWASQRTAQFKTVPPPTWSSFSQADHPHKNLCEQASGWPMLAMTSLQIPIQSSNSAQTVDGIDLGPNSNRQGNAQRVVLPTRPIGLGFAVDSVAYSIAWWIALLALIWVAGRIRRWPAKRRLRRGRCPACGYDLQGKIETGCPECGWRRPASESGAG